MNEIQPYQAGGGMNRQARRAAAYMSRHAMQTRMEINGMDNETDKTIAKFDSWTEATGHGMGAIFRVAGVQKQIEMVAPELAGRLSWLAEAHLAGVSDLLSEHRRAIRRY